MLVNTFKHEKYSFVIQARMNSKRLPGKVLKPFIGKPLLKFQVDLLKIYNLVENIIIATSINKENDIIEEFCNKNKLICFRGDEENVMRRFQLLVKKYPFENIIRLTGDNPLQDYQLLKKAINNHELTKADLTTTRKIVDMKIVKRFAPKGQTVDIIRSASLQKINSANLSPYEKEHVIPYFYREYKVEYVEKSFSNKENYSIDTLDDLYRLEKMVTDLISSNRLMNFLSYNE